MIARRAAGSVIVGSWVFCVGWAVARQVRRPPEAYLEARAARLAPGAAFYQITLGGSPIGNAGITLDTTLAGYRLTEVWNMDLASTTGTGRHVYRSDAELSRSLLLRKLTLSVSEDGAARFMEAEPKDDTTWAVRMGAPGSRPTALRSMEVPKSASAPGALPLRLALDGRLKEGGQLSQPVLALMYGTVDRDSARVTRDSVFAVSDSAAWDSTSATWTAVAARSTVAWRIERTVHGFPSIDWVDGQGRLVERDWAFGVRLERSPFEVNYNLYQTRLRQGMIRPPDRVPGRVARSNLPGPPDATARTMVVRLARADGPAWPGATTAFEGGRQQVHGDTVIIRVDTIPEAVSALMRAVQTVAPGERASRFLVLAGEAGIVARSVIGIDLGRLELPRHRWVEVRSGDRWLAVDPFYGQAPAAASLLRVAVGGSDRALTLVPLIGSLRSTTLMIQ